MSETDKVKLRDMYSCSEGSICSKNEDCPGRLICDGNLKTCRKHAHDDVYSWKFCEENGRICQEGEGDCDLDSHCEGSLRCGTDNCGKPGWPSGADCCRLK